MRAKHTLKTQAYFVTVRSNVSFPIIFENNISTLEWKHGKGSVKDKATGKMRLDMDKNT